ncbi:hypothetical protein BDB00DRAFT_829660 [Zychaea mexicana]|uniref:uncharacterized protein n=1 Tax=Zychaea mexicana TaxID=64656 RepID=UPI0022FE42FA|nr:uncharacterized protein BDB00DRAFT_829660 [Zychaea mexicana]KAI9492203.1 hypothetical protein BDB00DRAFT_829660 [Zychaea mexicana]
MRIVVTTETDDLYNLEIDSQMAIEDLKALLETESGLEPRQQELIHNGRNLDQAKKLLEEYGVAQDDLILLRRKTTRGFAEAEAGEGAGAGEAMSRYAYIVLPIRVNAQSFTTFFAGPFI